MELTNLERRILEALKEEGRASAPMIAEKVGTTPATVRTALVRLTKLGLVRRVYRGIYEPVEGA